MIKKISIFVAALLLIVSIAIPCMAVNSSNTDEKTYVLYKDNLKEERNLVSFNAYFAGENRVIILYAQKVNRNWNIHYKDENGKDYNNISGDGKGIFPANNYLPLSAETGLNSNKLDLIFNKNGLDIKNENNAVIMTVVINCETDINSIKVLDKESIEGDSTVDENATTTTTTKKPTSITKKTTDTTKDTTKPTSSTTPKSGEKKTSSGHSETSNKIWIIVLILIIICILAAGVILPRKKYEKNKTKSKRRKEEFSREIENDDSKSGEPKPSKVCTVKEDIHDTTTSIEVVSSTDSKNEKKQSKLSRKEIVEKTNQLYTGEMDYEIIRKITAQVNFSNSYDLNFSNSVKPRFKYSQNQENYVIIKDDLLCLNYDQFNEGSFAAYNDIRLLTRCFDIIDEDGDTVEPSGQRIKWLDPGIVSRMNDIFILEKKGKLIVERDYEK